MLTAYADTDAAIRAINSVQIDHYLMKPWDPPEERLYGVVDDLLDDWQASYHPVFEGVRVIGNRWSPQSNDIRDFLGRNFVPHQWLNIETDEAARQLLDTTGAGISSLPVVVFPDGSFLGNLRPSRWKESIYSHQQSTRVQNSLLLGQKVGTSRTDGSANAWWNSPISAGFTEIVEKPSKAGFAKKARQK